MNSIVSELARCTEIITENKSNGGCKLLRDVKLNEITDGKFYGLNDMVKAGCNDCDGCSACCCGMGTSILLDPLDVNRLSNHLNLGFEELLVDKMELNLVDGVILPNLKMAGDKESCTFLNSQGRCSIHAARPGICRLFPLGRYYNNHAFQYILQNKECRKESKTKVKVRKWIDTPDINAYERFIIEWHYFILDVQKLAKEIQEDDKRKQIMMYVLEMFYVRPYDSSRDFYQQFYERLSAAKENSLSKKVL